jgi:predicted nuclease of restriction endonuclease-like (RecB) superfamily
MTDSERNLSKTNGSMEDLAPLTAVVRDLITQARQKLLRTADTVQVQTYWQIGRHIVEYEQQGKARAAHGKALLARLAESLTREFGRGFDASNLRYMRAFYQAFPNCDALRHELSWTHYRLLQRVDKNEARLWYMHEAADQNWSTRVLERHINTLSYERILSSQDQAGMLAQTRQELSTKPASPRDFVRDPVLLEFLGLPETGRLLEGQLESALMNKLQQFLLELGKGFAFVARQQRISTETQDFFIDLVFYNYLLKCFVLIDLKAGHLEHQDIGQMDMYVRMYDDLRRGPGDNPTVGILLCGSKDHSVVRYSVLKDSEQIFASKYRLVLPSEDELRLELERDRQELEERSTIDDEEESYCDRSQSEAAR